MVGVVDETTQSEPHYIDPETCCSLYDRLISCPLPAASALCDTTLCNPCPSNPPSQFLYACPLPPTPRFLVCFYEMAELPGVLA